jgi:hypothetical protein
MTMPTFKNLDVWHSDLREATAGDVMRVRFTGPVRASKFSKPDSPKPDYIPFQIDGEDREYRYQVENPSIAEWLQSAPIGEWVMLRALGKDKTATLELRTPPAPPGTRPDSAPAAAAGGAGGEAAVAGAGEAADRSLAAELYECYDTALAVAKELKERKQLEMPPEEVGQNARMFFIERMRSGGRRPLRRPP